MPEQIYRKTIGLVSVSAFDDCRAVVEVRMDQFNSGQQFQIIGDHIHILGTMLIEAATELAKIPVGAERSKRRLALARLRLKRADADIEAEHIETRDQKIKDDEGDRGCAERQAGGDAGRLLKKMTAAAMKLIP